MTSTDRRAGSGAAVLRQCPRSAAKGDGRDRIAPAAGSGPRQGEAAKKRRDSGRPKDDVISAACGAPPRRAKLNGRDRQARSRPLIRRVAMKRRLPRGFRGSPRAESCSRSASLRCNSSTCSVLTHADGERRPRSLSVDTWIFHRGDLIRTLGATIPMGGAMVLLAEMLR